MSYQVYRNDIGQVVAINEVETGASVPFWDETDPATIAFREWLKEHPDFDISDHPLQPRSYRVYRNSLGQVDAINEISTGASVYYWDEVHPTTIAFHEWLAEHPDFDMSDHEPEPEPTPPDWQQFRAQVLSHSAYFRIIGAHPQNHILNVPLVWALGEVGKNPPILAEVINLWSAIAYNASPTADEINSLNAIAQACAMPFHLDEQGMMVSP